MNKKIGIYSSILNTAAVFCFSISMIIGSDYWSYISSMFISFSFVPMICSFCYFSQEEKKVAAYTAMIFSAVYTVFILAVYFAQVTTVASTELNTQASQIIDYSQFGLFFNYDLLGYGLMALATFFAGITIEPKNKRDRWLKSLLIIHGIFFISCLLLPILGVFQSDWEGADWIGTAVLQFWCVYFIPIGILSVFHFKNK